MDEARHILVVEDDDELRSAVCETLQIAGYCAFGVASVSEAVESLRRHQASLIISDVQLGDVNGDAFLKLAKKHWPEVPFVLITAYGTVEKAVAAIRDGAADYVTKPFEAEVLIEMVARLVLADTCSHDSHLVITDELSHRVTNLALRVAASEVSVMISGESGTGKELYARLIHNKSRRKDNPFIAINCAAIPETMLESMLFGYDKGAFTGAYHSRAGKFEQANHGTLLLDEISEMHLGLQSKLLRVLQEQEVERLGGSQPIPLDVRVLATTNRNLSDEVAAGRFREDLYFRLNVFPLKIPGLRYRPGDILPMARSFISNWSAREHVEMTGGAIERLMTHSWPGNVRELENVIQRALILRAGSLITEDCIVFEESVFGIFEPQVDRTKLGTPVIEKDLKSCEKDLILDVLLAQKGRRKETAAQLGISPRTLRYKLARFKQQGIRIPSASTA